MPTRRHFLAGAVAGTAAAAEPQPRSNVIALRTHEWFGDRIEQFEFPPDWQISVQHMKGHLAPVLSPAEIQRAVRNPVGTKPLREIAEGRSTVVDRLRRPDSAHAHV